MYECFILPYKALYRLWVEAKKNIALDLIDLAMDFVHVQFALQLSYLGSTGDCRIFAPRSKIQKA